MPKQIITDPAAYLLPPLRAKLESLTKERDSVAQVIANLEKLTTSTTTTAEPQRRKSKRRSTAKVIKQAHGMLSDIQAAGKNGLGGKELKKKWGQVFPSIKVFIQDRTGTKLKTIGARAAMRYFA